MPQVTTGVDRKSDAPTRVFYAKKASNLRLQLEALPSEYDQYGRLKRAAKNVVAQFKGGFYRTNRPSEVEAIEDSIAFRQGQIVDFEAMQAEARARRAEELTDLIASDPKVAEIVADKLGMKVPKGKKEA